MISTVGLGDNAGQGTQEMKAVGTGLMATAPLCGPAAPFVLAAGAIINTLAAIGVGSGCGEDCIRATGIVNQAEPVLQKNVDDYENGVISQSTAETAFNQIWLAVQTSCGAIPGQGKCVSDRQRGACTWKQKDPPKYPGQPQVGECFDWFNAYYDPLTQPAVNAPVGSSEGDLVSGIMSNPMLLIGGVALLIGLSMGGKE